MNFDGATYHVHSDSVTNSISRMQLTNDTREILYELLKSYPDDVDLSQYLEDVLVWNYRHYRLSNNVISFWAHWVDCLKISRSVAFSVLKTIVRRKINRRI